MFPSDCHVNSEETFKDIAKKKKKKLQITLSGLDSMNGCKKQKVEDAN